MTHRAPASYPASTQANYDHGDVDDGALSPMPRGRLDDADFRTERAKLARAAQNRPDYHLRQVLRAGANHNDDRWAIALAAGLHPLTPAEAAAARRLAAALVWAADLAEVTP